jgi:uncharacterized membrane protein YuzA (DUF378 family)
MMNWIIVWNVFASAILSGLLGMGSAKVIADLNGSVTYGHYASYIVTGLLVIIFNVQYIDFSKKEKK